MSRPVAIDLFAGAGGMSLGFEQAGFDVAAAVEIDPVHAAVHKFNFPASTVIPRSVEGLTGNDIRKLSKLGRCKVHVVFGGAPCQGFSLIGARVLDDPRNGLVREFVRLVVELEADYFVFENVKGITVGAHAQILRELVTEFGCNGYDVVMPWRVLNASFFGVPQDRERLFLMGCKRGLKLPTYPAPICRPAGSPSSFADLPQGPSCRDALGDLPDAESFNELWRTDGVRARFGKPSDYAKAMRCLTNDCWGYGYPRRWEPSILTGSMRTDHTDISRRRFAATVGGMVEPISRFFKLPAAGVSNTLRAGTDGARGAFTSPRPIHYDFARCVTVREMARLHGFPDWFRLHETKWHGARQVGNAVPPPVARAIARRIAVAMDHVPSAPDNVLELGALELLRLDPGKAAEYFGVKKLAGKRDRKAAPKRRQWDDAAGDRLAAD